MRYHTLHVSALNSYNHQKTTNKPKKAQKQRPVKALIALLASIYRSSIGKKHV